MSNEQIIWNYLMKEIKNAFGVAGLMGNIQAESALNPKNLQNSYEKKLGYNDDTYTAAVDNGTYTNFVKDAAGYGLCQWTYWSRKQNMLNYAKSKGKSIGDVEMQLGFLMQELNGGYKGVINTLKSATSVLEASNAVLLQFERPANQGASVQATRAKYGQTFYDKYAKSSVSGSTSTTGTASKKSVDEVAAEVLQGKWGSGVDRKNKLTTAGYNYTEVQNKVNQLVKGKKSTEEIAKEVIAGKWGSGAARKQKLTAAGYNYSEVQAMVNKLLK